jgi:Na+-driven multidrug efflux pump
VFTDGLLLAALDYKYCMLTNLANLMVIGGFLGWSAPSGLPGVWCAMVLFQGSRLVQNLFRLHQRRMLNPYLRNARDA